MERIVYTLIAEERAFTCIVRTTKLMKWEAFSSADCSNLKTLFLPRYTDYLQAEDRPILMGLLQLTKRDGEFPLVDGAYGHEVFQQMLNTRRLFFDGGTRLRLKAADARTATLDWQQLAGNKWQPIATFPDTPGIAAYPLDPPIYIDPATNTCGLLQLNLPPALAAQWLAADKMTEPEVARFCLRLAKRFPDSTFPVPPCVTLNEVTPERPQSLLTIEQRALVDRRDRQNRWIDLRDRLRLRLRFRYREATVDWDSTDPSVSFRRDDTIIRIPRDRSAEAEILAQLSTWGFTADTTFAESDFFNFDSSVFALSSSSRWRTLLKSTFAALPSSHWQIAYPQDLRVTIADESAFNFHAHECAQGTYRVNLGLTFKQQEVPLLPLLHQALRTQKKRGAADLQQWLTTGDFAVKVETATDDPVRTRLISIPPPLLTKLTEYLHELFDAKPFDASGSAQLNQWRVGELVAAGLIARPAEAGLAQIVRLCQKLADGIAVIPRPAPPSLCATLRPYQEGGLGWLHTLGEVNAGGILADDMGLGKTVQTIAHLLELHAANQLTQGALLVAPTSVIDNWESELARFAPNLTVAKYHGSDRESAWPSSPPPDVVITTYQILWRDLPRLSAHCWNLVVLDEAQYIKNASSRTSQAARNLVADRKLCLSGTPIENRLQDIWALFEFLLPGFLGDETTFNQRIAKPLSGDNDEAEFATILRSRLRQRLAPFVLRRLKEDVLPDLPAKTEVTLAVSMTPRQASLYAETRREARDNIRQTVDEKGLAGSRIQILTRLLRLRQICCDPRLLDADRDVPDRLHDSAKLTALMELVTDLRARGSRTLIFSQFTSMLDLIGRELTAQGHDFLLLTGSTLNRSDVVQKFQSGGCPLFLISLRAGGSGLNLTAADSVIHYDPWWNPAVERQATDRTHRIGQSKPVFVYKLIVDDSIESKIQQLQHTKLELVRGLLNAGDVEHLQLDQSTIDYLLSE
jgi:hypothetical protein